MQKAGKGLAALGLIRPTLVVNTTPDNGPLAIA